jgi:hypothetical protein
MGNNRKLRIICDEKTFKDFYKIPGEFSSDKLKYLLYSNSTKIKTNANQTNEVNNKSINIRCSEKNFVDFHLVPGENNRDKIKYLMYGGKHDTVANEVSELKDTPEQPEIPKTNEVSNYVSVDTLEAGCIYEKRKVDIGKFNNAYDTLLSISYDLHKEGFYSFFNILEDDGALEYHALERKSGDLHIFTGSNIDDILSIIYNKLGVSVTNQW